MYKIFGFGKELSVEFNTFGEAKKALEGLMKDYQFTVKVSDVLYKIFQDGKYAGSAYIKKYSDDDKRVERYKASHDGMTPEQYRACYEREARRDNRFYREEIESQRENALI